MDDKASIEVHAERIVHAQQVCTNACSTASNRLNEQQHATGRMLYASSAHLDE